MFRQQIHMQMYIFRILISFMHITTIMGDNQQVRSISISLSFYFFLNLTSTHIMECVNFFKNCSQCIGNNCFFVYFNPQKRACVNSTRFIIGDPEMVLSSLCPEFLQEAETTTFEEQKSTILLESGKD
jgi:hypothetical protein